MMLETSRVRAMWNTCMAKECKKSSELRTLALVAWTEKFSLKQDTFWRRNW